MNSFATFFDTAWKRRQELRERADTDCYRLFNGLGDGFGGVEIDRYGAALVIRSQDLKAEEILTVVDPYLNQPTVVFKTGHHGREPLQLLRGDGAPQIVSELGLRFQVEPHAATNPGLYLDARPCRQWLVEHCQQRRVLNLFSFTGSLGVAALAGGARSVEHVDGQRRSLSRAVENHKLNTLHVDGRDFVKSDVYPYLKACIKKKRCFGGIILDPPPKIPGRGNQDLAELLQLCQPLVQNNNDSDDRDDRDDRGWVIVLVHEEDTVIDDIAAIAEFEVSHRGKAGEDFPRLGDYHGMRWYVLKRGR